VPRRTPSKVAVSLNLGFVQLSGEWEPNDTERKAAWELYVELITRVSTVPLGQDEGLLREALNSLYSIFDTTRQILRTSGPDIAEPKPDGGYSFAYLAVTILNSGIRPLLATWHPRLADWEIHRPADSSPAAHERAWPHAGELRAELERTRGLLAAYADVLATACGVPNLLSAVPTADRT
jgi:hypothetical protein